MKQRNLLSQERTGAVGSRTGGRRGAVEFRRSNVFFEKRSIMEATGSNFDMEFISPGRSMSNFAMERKQVKTA